MVEEAFGLEACVVTEHNLIMLVIYTVFNCQIIIGFSTLKELLKGMLTSQQIIATSRRNTVTMK